MMLLALLTVGMPGASRASAALADSKGAGIAPAVTARGQLITAHKRHARSSSRPGAKPRFTSLRSRRSGGPHSGSGAIQRNQAASQPGTELGTITFSEYPAGTSITDQYQLNGIDFGGDSPFITDDSANPTSPVLSGTPQFSGSITGTFVQSDGTPRTVDSFSVDAGYIDTAGSTEVIAYDSAGNVLDTVPINTTGIVTVSISVPGIASFLVQTIDPNNPDPSGWAIDNVTFEGYKFLAGPPTAAEQGGAPNASENNTTCYVAEPVNCATGSLLAQFGDFLIPGRGIVLSLTRTYSSALAAMDGPLGFGWTDSYALSLSADGAGDVTIMQESGSTVTFTPGDSGGFVAPDRVLAGLVQNADGSYTFTRTSSQDQFNFSAGGKLTSEVDRNGNTTTLAYNGSGQLASVTDPSGRQLTFTYSGPHIATVTDPTGRTWSYTYDGSGNLATATDPMGRTWSFGYDAGHLLTSVKDPRGGVTFTSYDLSGQVVSQTDPDGNTTTWSYTGDATSAAGGTTTMTDPNGNVTTYSYANLELLSVTSGAGSADAATTSYTYDPATLGVTSVTDPNGNVTVNTYDLNGDLLSTTDPDGNTTSYTYDAFGQVLTKTSPLSEVTGYAYDGTGNLVTVTHPLGDVTTYAYGGAAHPGDLTSVTDADGHVTTYTYDAQGDVTSIRLTPSAGVTDITGYAYDADGERTCQASPNASAAGISCPAAGSPPVAGTMVTAYNADGEITSVTDANGHATSYVYDADGNRTQVTNSAGQVISYSYNGDSQQTKITRPDGTALSTRYDAGGNVAARTDAAGATTQYAYDALNRLISVTNPLSLTTRYGYDPAGNEVSLTNPSGQVTTYAYDPANLLTSISYSDGVTAGVSYTYDADGQRSSMSDGTGTTSYSFNPDGRLTAVTNGAGATVSYGYDHAGQLTSLTYPNGNVVSRSYDGAGNLTAVTDWLGNTTRFSYDHNGNVVAEAYPNGITATAGFDQADQLMSITDKTTSATLASFSYTRDARGQIKSVTQGGILAGTLAYSYNQLGQLATDNTGSYGYDPAGNLTKLPGSVTQAYNAGGELTSTTQPGPVTAPSTGQVTSANETTRAAKIISPAVTTTSANKLVLAFISADGPVGQKITAVSGGGLTWSLAVRSNSQRGTAEVWQAHASSKLTAAKITATLADRGYNGSITIATFTHAGAKVGAHAAAAAASRAPAVSLTTTGADSLIWAVGEDSQHARARTPASGQSLVHQYLDAAGPSTEWVQKQNAAAGASHTTVKIADTAPTSDRWEYAAVEITAAPPVTVKTTYGYDQEGNRTSASTPGQAQISLTYDQVGHLIGYGSSASYSYDGDGLRMSKTVNGTTTPFAWDQSGSLPLVLAAGAENYIYGPGNRPIEQISGSTATYLLPDQVGSTRLLTDAAGAVVGTYTYGPYGNTASHTGTATAALRYDGQYTDAESGFQYLQARYYDPSTGQFLSQDPMVNATGQPYAYAGGSPLTFADPGGLIAVSCALLHSLPAEDLDNLYGYLDGLAGSVKDAATIYSYLLRYGSTPAIRSYAARLLPIAGRIANFGPIKVIDKLNPVASLTIGFSADLLEGDSIGRASLRTGASTGLGSAGGALGGGVCVLLASGTAGVGALTCPALIFLGSAGGTWAGDKLGGWIADRLHW